MIGMTVSIYFNISIYLREDPDQHRTDLRINRIDNETTSVHCISSIFTPFQSGKCTIRSLTFSLSISDSVGNTGGGGSPAEGWIGR